MLSATKEELLYLADQQADARARYHEDDADLIRESMVIEHALRLSAQQREPGGWRVTDWDQARAAGRILLVWKAFGGVKEHIELGRYKSSAAAWVNTYGHPFSGDPDGWAPLLPFDGPSEAIADVSVDELAAARAVLDRLASSGRR